MLKELDSSEFTYELYKPELISTIPNAVKDNDLCSLLIKIDTYSVGQCDGTLLEFRPRKEASGVMFDYKGERFWLHVDNAWLKATVTMSWLVKQDTKELCK